VFILLDVLLLGIAITTLALGRRIGNEHTTECSALFDLPMAFLLTFIFCSFCVDFFSLRQIKNGYTGRYLAGASIILDICIFAVGIWEIVVVAQVDEECDFVGFWGISTGIVLVVLTFARVYYIVWMLLFPICVLPCYYMPSCCPCRRFFTEDNSKEVWELLLES
jgi:hypothetical protein